mmetsp:Transcript_47978/g.102001  ORF Transcript_47978/g.102001 Transcript_47978/m.102001 type:complete len:360 (-) Transcript_47978:170-1249(-)
MSLPLLRVPTETDEAVVRRHREDDAGQPLRLRRAPPVYVIDERCLRERRPVGEDGPPMLHGLVEDELADVGQPPVGLRGVVRPVVMQRAHAALAVAGRLAAVVQHRPVAVVRRLQYRVAHLPGEAGEAADAPLLDRGSVVAPGVVAPARPLLRTTSLPLREGIEGGGLLGGPGGGVDPSPQLGGLVPPRPRSADRSLVTGVPPSTMGGFLPLADAVGDTVGVAAVSSRMSRIFFNNGRRRLPRAPPLLLFIFDARRPPPQSTQVLFAPVVVRLGRRQLQRHLDELPLQARHLRLQARYLLVPVVELSSKGLQAAAIVGRGSSPARRFSAKPLLQSHDQPVPGDQLLVLGGELRLQRFYY